MGGQTSQLTDSTSQIAEIRSQKKAGKWKLTTPMTNNYKKIQCKCIGSDYYADALAKLTIPAGATVIRPLVNMASIYETPDYQPSDKLRSDKAFTEKIIQLGDKPIDNTKCKAGYFSKSPFTYTEGEMQETELDPDDKVQCTKGIHFFTEEDKARFYII
jgi:hypothetical protein